MHNTHCPICGKYVGDEKHRCDPKILQAIDNATDNERDYNRKPHFEERLKDGFEILSEDDS